MDFCNHKHPLVKELAAKFRYESQGGDDAMFVALAFNWVRDEIKYVILNDWTVGVEYTIEHRKGNCGTKACLLGAILKAGGIVDIRFGFQTIPTSDTFFFVPQWVTGECSNRSVHMTVVALLNGKWTHLDTSLDMVLARSLNGGCGGRRGDMFECVFDGKNHAVMGGRGEFDQTKVTVLQNLDKYMIKKSRLQPAFRNCFNLTFEFCRANAQNFACKESLKKRVEKHFVSKHPVVCQEISYLLTQQRAVVTPKESLAKRVEEHCGSKYPVVCQRISDLLPLQRTAVIAKQA